MALGDIEPLSSAQTITKYRRYDVKATIGCPITCGIFARIAAGAADENAKEGKQNITPYWRTLKAGGVINEKYPGGVEW